MLAERYSIYGLSDNYGIIRYVGKTKFSLEKRLKTHLKRLKGNDHRANWIRGLLKSPLIQLLAETNEEKTANILEILLIAFYKSFGCQLTNGTEGGTGGSTFKGRRHSIESRLKMSKRPWNYEKHLSKEIKRKISESLKGHFISEITKEKISKILKGRKNTPEQSKKQSEAQKGKRRKPHSLETR